jgi:hypothetical protein
VLNPGKAVYSHANSEACYKLIENWIQDCTSRHASCASTKDSRLPTRVIDVGQAGDIPKLYVTCNENAPYIALSHCWGSFQIITTTKNTLENRKEGIEWTDLSKTFQDAITITRKLGVRYLWIDSLCIIQDDSEDWQIESSRMGPIYRDSYLTVCATLSANGRGGCFLERNAQSGNLSERLDDTDGKYPSGVYVRRKFEGSHNILDPFATREVEAFPLHSRAWAFQERLLATRVVQYTREELRWECKSDIKCECGSFDLQTTTAHGTGTFKSYYNDSKTADSKTLRAAWSRILELFSERKLTYESDRLPALSAIAQDVQNDLTGEYLAGLWEKFLPEDLLWEVLEPRVRAEAYRAPSWSWASLDSSKMMCFSSRTQYADEVIYPHRVHVRVLEVDCKPAGRNPKGNVQSGHLKITGPLVEPTHIIAFYPNSNNTRNTHNVAAFRYPDEFASDTSDTKLLLKTQDDSFPGKQVFFLRCITFTINPDGKAKKVASLVLVPSDRVANAFERIGRLVHDKLGDAEEFYREAKETTITIV